MRIISLLHVPFEDAADLGVWAARRGHQLTSVKWYDGQRPPAVDTIDAVFIMGGLMNIYQEAEYPWLREEKRFLAECVRQDKILIGVCLGAQLLADVLGGKVTQNRHREIGWHEVVAAPAVGQSPLADVLPERFWAFHWHSDTFSLPPGATHLAESAACGRQAFLYGPRILGLQCHLEYTKDSIEKMLTYCADELDAGPYVQTPDAIRDGYRHLPGAQHLLWTLLDRLTGEKTPR